MIVFLKDRCGFVDSLHERECLAKNCGIFGVFRFEAVLILAQPRFDVGKLSLNLDHTVVQKSHVGTDTLYVRKNMR